MDFHKKILIGLITLSLLASLAYSFIYKIEPAVDARAYDNIAVNIASGFGFKEDPSQSYEFDTSIVRAGPTYEYFLAGIYKVFGHNFEWVWIFQAIIHVLTVYLIFLICWNIFKENGEKIGLIAGLIIGLHPDLIEISAMLMTETLYLFFVVWAVYLFVKIFNAPKNLWLQSLFGIVFGLAILSRPPVLLFLPIILLIYLFKKYYLQAAVLMIFIVAVFAPWTIRNYKIYHQFIPTTLITEYNLWVGNTLQANGGQISGGYNSAMNYAQNHGYFNFADEAKAQFKDFVLSQPITFLKLTALRVIRYFSLIRPMGFWFYQQGLGQIIFAVSSLISIAFIFIFGFAGMAAAFLKKKQAILNYLILFALTAPLALISAVVESRYRFQIYPFLAIFGAYFLVDFYYKRKENFKTLIITGLVLLAVTLVDVACFWPTIYARLQTFF